MYKTLHGVTPDYLRSRFVYRDDVSAYRTSKKVRVIPKFPQKSVLQYSSPVLFFDSFLLISCDFENFWKCC